MSKKYKYLSSLLFFVAILNATHALQFNPIQTFFQHQAANDHRMPGDQPVSLTIEDGSDEEFLGQSPMEPVQPDAGMTDHIHFLMTNIPEKPVFPFRRPPKMS